MKINVGIVGYGNLGKALEKEILKNRNYNLVAIFSRRTIKSNFNTLVESYDSYVQYKGKIDIMFLCGGSIYDLESQTPEISKTFNTINTFDTHAKIQTQLELLSQISKENETISIISCGWDPGIFSIARALFSAISNFDVYTFWGKGISMGHSDALRRVEGVVDGVQFTVPNKEAIKLAKLGKLDNNIHLHYRDCYIVSHDTDEIKIENTIKNIPNYFAGQPTKVSFVNSKELIKLKKKLYHKGEVISYLSDSNKNYFKLDFKAKMSSNPTFTAKIMIAYSKAVINMMNKKIFGAFTPLDIPVSYLYSEDEKDKLLKLC